MPVTDYGKENPLLYDFYGFSPELYKLKFKSRGDSMLSQRIVQLYEQVSPISSCSIFNLTKIRLASRLGQLLKNNLEVKMSEVD
jgi:hypothetical protein